MRNLLLLLLLLISLTKGYTQALEEDLIVGLHKINFSSASGGYNYIQSYGGSSVSGSWVFKSRFDHLILDAGINSSNPRVIAFKVGGAEKFRINSNGYLGIGTNSPRFLLDIKTNISHEGNNLYFGDRRIYLAGITGTGSQMYGGMVLENLGNGVRSLDLVVGNNDFTTNTTPSNSIMRLQSNGNIGIGTTTPDYKLDVLGTIRAHEIKVQTTGADFVFESDYDLPTLQEVENYINLNGHLQDIPSAEEVEENGISLGEMNAKLLQKIEELTLYVIELNKENEDMKVKDEVKKKKIEELKSENQALKTDLFREIETIKTQLK